MFLCFSSMGDFGSYRKWLMIISSFIGASTNFFMFGLGAPETFGLMAVLLVIGNVTFGYSVVMYNAYLPYLCKDHPEVRKLIEAKEKAHKVVDKYKDIQDVVSNTGYQLGYVSGVVVLIFSMGIFIVMSGTLAPLFIIRLCCLIGGTWWFIFTFPTMFYLTDRPGPPIPNNGGFVDLIYISVTRLSESA